MVGEEGLEPSSLIKAADFKSAVYTIPPLSLEAPTGIEPVYKVLQTSA